MADDGGDDRGAAAGVPAEVAPILMDDLVHKLLILDYVKGFCQPKDITPFSRIYFAIPAPNVALQYQHFINLASWLLGQARRTFAVDKYEDPTSTLTRLVAEIKGAGFEQQDVLPMKLRIAHGELVCKVLCFLADGALTARGFRFHPPSITEEGHGDDDIEIEEDDGLDDQEDDVGGSGSGGGNGRRAGSSNNGQIDDDAEADVLFVEVASKNPFGSSSSSSSTTRSEGKDMGDNGNNNSLALMLAESAASSAATTVLESTVDPIAWRAEVERVGPRLKVPVPGGGGGSVGSSSSGGGGSGNGIGVARGEWRGHLEQTRVAEGMISKYLPTSRETLSRLGADLADTLELVSARENFINSSLKHLAAEHRGHADKMTELSGQLTNAQGKMASFSNELAVVSEALEDVKALLEERGASMTDTSPLIRIKAALANLRGEIKSLDLQIGVSGHAVMQHRISHKADMRAAAAVRTVRGGNGHHNTYDGDDD